MNIGLLSLWPDIIVLTETWLHIGVANSEIGLYDYAVYRREKFDFPHSPSGGSIFIAVKNKLESKLIFTSDNNEEIYVEITNQSKKLVIGGFYAPYVISDLYTIHVNNVKDLLKNTNMMIF